MVVNGLVNYILLDHCNFIYILNNLLCPETQIALPIDLVIKLFHHISKWQWNCHLEMWWKSWIMRSIGKAIWVSGPNYVTKIATEVEYNCVDHCWPRKLVMFYEKDDIHGYTDMYNNVIGAKYTLHSI